MSSFGNQGAKRGPTIGKGSGSKLRGMQESRDELPPAVSSAPGSPAPASRRPSGYGDALLWAMAEEFERQAYENRVSLGGRGVPYIYKALAQSVDRLGMQRLSCTDGDGREVRGPELGVRLVRFFWNRWPWDRDGDVLSQFSDPITFMKCLRELRSRWTGKRAHERIQKRIAQNVPEEFHRAPGKAVGYKHLGG